MIRPCRKSDIPAEVITHERTPRRFLIQEFIQSADEAWELIPEGETINQLYGAYKSAVLRNPMFRRKCDVLWRNERVFLVRYANAKS